MTGYLGGSPRPHTHAQDPDVETMCRVCLSASDVEVFVSVGLLTLFPVRDAFCHAIFPLEHDSDLKQASEMTVEQDHVPRADSVYCSLQFPYDPLFFLTLLLLP